MKKIAVISVILEDPAATQQEFNEIVSAFSYMVRGRMGIPFEDAKIGVISLIVVGTIDEINSLTGKLGRLPQVAVKTAISKKEI